MKKYLVFVVVVSSLMAGSLFANDGPGSNGQPANPNDAALIANWENQHSQQSCEQKINALDTNLKNQLKKSTTNGWQALTGGIYPTYYADYDSFVLTLKQNGIIASWLLSGTQQLSDIQEAFNDLSAPPASSYQSGEDDSGQVQYGTRNVPVGNPHNPNAWTTTPVYGPGEVNGTYSAGIKASDVKDQLNKLEKLLAAAAKAGQCNSSLPVLKVEDTSWVASAKSPADWKNSYKATNGTIWSGILPGAYVNCIKEGWGCRVDPDYVGTSSDGLTVTNSDAVQACKAIGGALPTEQDFANLGDHDKDILSTPNGLWSASTVGEYDTAEAKFFLGSTVLFSGTENRIGYHSVRCVAR
jgi:hypothetical protein